MKKYIFLLISILWATNLFPQNITGKWFGELEIRGQKTPLVVHIQKTANGYSSTMDSPKQKVYGVPMYKTSFANGNLFILSNQGFSYRGFLYDGEITGKFKQNGLEFPLTFTRNEIVEEEAPKEPEKPQETRDFISEDVFFENPKAGITLAGTLTMPLEGGNFPAVILISGSGPQNRDEELFGHKPFLVLSDYFTRKGIAVLRYDDRGVGKSEGDFSSATTADFAIDAQAAVDYLLTRKEIDKTEIGLLGHSEGGIIAPMIASKSGDVAFLVLLAAPGIPGDDLIASQNRMIGKASGMTETQLDSAEKINLEVYQMVINSTNTDSLKADLTDYLKSNHPSLSDAQIEAEIKKITPWMQYFLKYDPRPALEKTTIPVLALNGEKDLQVPAERNLNAIETALKNGGNTNVTTKVLPGLNHLFQECETGLPSEYGKIEQTFSPVAMEIIGNWIMEQTD